MQKRLTLRDPAAEEMLHNMQSMCQFAGLWLTRGGILDVTTTLNFCLSLEEQQLASRLLGDHHCAA